MVAVRIPFLLGHAEIATLYGLERQTSQKWRTDGTLGVPDLVVSGNPYWLLPTVLQLQRAGSREVSAQRLAEYESGIPGGYLAEDAQSLPPIVGIKEVASLLGKGDQTIAKWRHRKAIVEADLALSGSPLWLLETILVDSRLRGRSVVPEVFERIQAGEHAPQKPRGRRSAQASARPPRKPLPPAQSFAGADQAGEAEAFVVSLLAQGYTVVVTPKT